MFRSGKQEKLFDTGTRLPNGLIYRPNFITEEEEAEILSCLELLPLEKTQIDKYESKRSHFNFGWSYDRSKEKFIKGPPLPPFLKRVQIKIAKWLDISPKRVVEALVNEYPPNTGIGWHRDNEKFEHVVGLSLNNWARIRFRPLQKIGLKKNTKDIISLELESRSCYIMQKDIRWKWQHSIAPTKGLRYSITFRTLPKEIKVK